MSLQNHTRRVPTKIREVTALTPLAPPRSAAFTAAPAPMPPAFRDRAQPSIDLRSVQRRHRVAAGWMWANADERAGVSVLPEPRRNCGLVQIGTYNDRCIA